MVAADFSVWRSLRYPALVPQSEPAPARTPTRLLDAALLVLGERGARDLTLRAVEDAAGVPHGSIRHHFGDRRGLLVAVFDHLEQLESAPTSTPDSDDPQAADTPDDRSGHPLETITGLIQHWLGPGRTVTLARYELFLLAARDPALRAPLVRARERFVHRAALVVGPERAPAVVAAIDGVVLDALVRGDADPTALRSKVAHLLGG